MALIKCPDCGKLCSDLAEQCTECGRPLKDSANPLLKEDKVIVARRDANLFAPIFWLIVVIICFIICVIFQVSKDYPFLFVMSVLSNILLFLLIFPCIFTIISRARNNKVNKAAIIYRSATDSFEINHLNKKPILLKRTSIVKVTGGTTTYIYYRENDGKIKKTKVAYCDEPYNIIQEFNKFTILK